MNSLNFFRLLGFSAFLKSIFYYSQFAMARCCICPRYEYWYAWLLLQRIWPEKLRFTVYDLMSYRFFHKFIKTFYVNIFITFLVRVIKMYKMHIDL